MTMRSYFTEIIKEKFGAQVFLAIVALIFLLSLSSILLLSRFQNATMISELENSGRLIAQMLAYQSRIALFSENEGMLQTPVESLFQNETVVGVCLFNQMGGLVIEKTRQNGVDPLYSDQDVGPDIQLLIQSLSRSSSPRVFHADDSLVIWQPVIWGNSFPVEETLYSGGGASDTRDDPFGYVKITLGKRQLKEKLKSNLLKTILLGLGFLVIGALIAYFLAMQIHQPIKQLTDNVRRFGEKGDCDDLIVKSRNEIGKLSIAFQEMTYSLKGYVQREIETANELAHNRNLAHPRGGLQQGNPRGGESSQCYGSGVETAEVRAAQPKWSQTIVASGKGGRQVGGIHFGFSPVRAKTGSPVPNSVVRADRSGNHIRASARGQ